MIRKEFPQLREHYYESVLPCGLTVRVVPRPGFSRKHAFLAVRCGSSDVSFTLGDRKVLLPAGTAHYLEHKIFDLPEGSVMQRFAAAGASDNAFTSYSMTAFFFECADAFEENLRTLLEMVFTPWFTEQSVEKERGIIAQEIRMYEDSPGSAVSEQLYEAMYERHPLRLPIAGTVESIGEITPETLQTCYDAFYYPANMMLCCVGDLDPENVEALAAEYAKDRGLARAEPDWGPAPSLKPWKARVQREMEISMPTFQMGFACPAPKNGAEVQEAEIIGELAADLLMGESSPLYTALYEEGLIDATFGSGYEELRGTAMLSAGGDSDEPERVLERILKERDRLLRDGPEKGLFERLRRAALGSRLRELDSFDGITARMCGYFFEDAEYYDFPAAFSRVGEEQVLEFLSDTLRPERACLSVILPKGGR